MDKHGHYNVLQQQHQTHVFGVLYVAMITYPLVSCFSTENDSESDADLFLADAGIDEDVQESKQRRATVSGGSPTIKRPTIKITQFTGRPKSDTIILCSPSSEESVSTESLTPDGLTTPDAEMKAPPTGQCALHIDSLVQDCSNSSALAMELLQSCAKPSICHCHFSLKSSCKTPHSLPIRARYGVSFVSAKSV